MPAPKSRLRVRAKDKFHHGDLRQALIDATRLLVAERGAEGFSLADACRLAGVSTAAPYKHFRDKDEILREVVKQAFRDLHAAMDAAVADAGAGSVAAMIAMGQSYLRFARKRSAEFRLMFGQDASVTEEAEVESEGRTCFGSVIDHVAEYCRRNAAAIDAPALALDLWTFVHGASCLLIDKDYEKVAPDLDVEALLARATTRLLGPAKTRR